jgi:hypothetical protein
MMVLTLLSWASTHGNIISKANPDIEPADISFMLADGSNVYVKFTALLDLHILTIAGPVVVRRHRVHVADKPMPDVLLGHPQLLCLGINVEKQICDIAVGDQSEFVGVPLTSNKPADELDSDTVEFGIDDASEVVASLEAAVHRAESNDAPSSFIDGLRILTHNYSDIFRLKLGHDPPANVEPLCIELVPGAEPVLCNVRRHAPLHLRFLSDHLQTLLDFGFGYLNLSSF